MLVAVGLARRSGSRMLVAVGLAAPFRLLDSGSPLDRRAAQARIWGARWIGAPFRLVRRIGAPLRLGFGEPVGSVRRSGSRSRQDGRRGL
eukprot:877857-Prorocentrum_minimum.AAC.1